MIGEHAVKEALKNKQRTFLELYTSGDKKLHEKQKKISKEKLQEIYQNYCQKNDFKIQKIQSDFFYLSDYQENNKIEARKILYLDGVTDVHNIAAIIRTAAFFKFDLCVLERKERKFSPDFFRLASGGAEHVAIKTVTKGLNFIKSLEHKEIYALDEKGNQPSYLNKEDFCLIVGAEDRGVAHALKRESTLLKLQAKGEFTTLNASVAAALAMQIFNS